MINLQSFVTHRANQNDIIAETFNKLRYWRNYSAEVVGIDEGMGYVTLKCLELMAIDEDSYIRARPVGNPRQYHPPSLGDSVVLFFRDCDPSYPLYIAEKPDDMGDGEGFPLSAVLIKTGTVGSCLSVDEMGGFTIESKSDLMRENPDDINSPIYATEPMVLGAKLKGLIDYLVDEHFNKIYEEIKLLNEALNKIQVTTAMGTSGTPLPPFIADRAESDKRMDELAKDLEKLKETYAKPGYLLSRTNSNN